MTSARIAPIEDYTVEDLHAADRLAYSNSLEDVARVSDRQLGMIAAYDPAAAERACVRRDQAIETLERQRLLAQARANASTSAPTAPRALAAKDIGHLTWPEIVKRFPEQEMSLTVEMFDSLLTRLDDMNTKNKWRNSRLDGLDARVKELEQQPAKGFAFRGAWGPDEAYAPNDLAVHGGSCWIATSPVSGIAPSTSGHGAENWSLFASRGRTGRSGDAR